jgi:hypothetical protein
VDALDVCPRGRSDLRAAGWPRIDQLGETLVQRLRRRVHDRDIDAVRLLGASDGLVVQKGDDRLAERHALDREEAVPAGVELVDDDVRVAVARKRLVVTEPLDDAEVDVEPRACLDDVVGSLAATRRRCVDDDGAPPGRRRRRGDRREVDARRDHRGVRDPADRVVAADDLGVRLPPVRELLARLPTDVGAEVVHHRSCPEGAQDRELERLWDERQPECEVEEIGARQELREHLPLGELTTDEPSVELERPVGLGVQRVAVEDHERRVDATPPERLDVRPWHTGGVDGAVHDAERAAPGRAHWSHSS